MAYHASGTLYIALEDFWAWVFKTNPEASKYEYNRVKSFDFSTVDLTLETTEGKKIFIDMVDFWVFTVSCLPNKDDDSYFGKPAVKDYDIEINFIVSNDRRSEEHPEWSKISAEWADHMA